MLKCNNIKMISYWIPNNVEFWNANHLYVVLEIWKHQSDYILKCCMLKCWTLKWQMSKCQNIEMFKHLYVQTLICSNIDMFKHWYVQTLICSNIDMFKHWYVQTPKWGGTKITPTLLDTPDIPYLLPYWLPKGCPIYYPIGYHIS